MKRDEPQNRCDACGKETVALERVCFSRGEERHFLCIKCFHEAVANDRGADFHHPSFDPVTLKDRNNKRHTFHFQTLLLGDHVTIEALEIQKDEPKGYQYSICGNVEDDLSALFEDLVARIRRELQRKHIESSDLTRFRIAKGDTLRGRITWDDETDGAVPCLVIDGKELSWHEVGRMLMTYEGFHFKLEIFEGSEER